MRQCRYEQFHKMLFEPRKHSETFWALRVKRLASAKQERTKKALSFENDKIYLWKQDGSDDDEPFGCRPHGRWRNGV